MNYVQYYSQVKSEYPFSLRRIARTLALDSLSLKESFTKTDSLLSKPRIQFLYFHHVFKDELPKLEALLKYLSAKHTFLSYSEAFTMLLEGKIDKPYIVFSSDDGLKNNLDAAKALADYGASACFFINPCIIGESDFNKVSAYCKTKLNLPPVEFLTWNDTEQLLKMGHEIGSHSMCHNKLSSLSEQQLTDDINASYTEIKAKCVTPKHFAFPYGNFTDFPVKGINIVYNAGFQSCASAERGCHIASATALPNTSVLLRRDHIIFDWPLNHIRHFILNNAKKASENNSLFPAQYYQ